MYLLVDVDGVLCPMTDSESYQWYDFAYVYWHPDNGDWLRRIAKKAKLVWATAWEERANEWISPLHGLWSLPVISFGESVLAPEWQDWKMPAITSFVGDKPFVWVDDDISPASFEWARERNESIPTLFVQPNPLHGLTDFERDEIEGFIDSHT